jgi:hypothetical protein
MITFLHIIKNGYRMLEVEDPCRMSLFHIILNYASSFCPLQCMDKAIRISL